MADGEGFEPPVELPPQRFSRPSQSTALPPILNFIIPPVFQTCGFVRWPLPNGAAHHSFALDCADACLADSYARPSQSTALPPILNFFSTAGLSNLRRGLKTLAIIQCLERIVNLSVMLIIILANPDARVIIITGEAT